MVMIEINEDEIKAFDIILNKADVRAMVGFKLISVRYKIEQALQKQAEKVQKNEKK